MTDGPICGSADLIDGGDGVEFEMVRGDEVLPAFAVRFRGVAYAYVNRCSHMDLKLNFLHADFFDVDNKLLICSTHGALYEPESGRCRGGPCNGLGLLPVAVAEHGGALWLTEPGVGMHLGGRAR